MPAKPQKMGTAGFPAFGLFVLLLLLFCLLNTFDHDGAEDDLFVEGQR